MSGILDRAKAHYEALDPKRLEVPEWGAGGKPLIVTFTALTVGERRKIFKVDGQGRAPDGPTACVRAVIEKACDESGKKLFTAMDEHDLTHKVDSSIVGRIAGAILIDVTGEEDLTDRIEAEKNG